MNILPLEVCYFGENPWLSKLQYPGVWFGVSVHCFPVRSLTSYTRLPAQYLVLRVMLTDCFGPIWYWSYSLNQMPSLCQCELVIIMIVELMNALSGSYLMSSLVLEQQAGVGWNFTKLRELIFCYIFRGRGIWLFGLSPWQLSSLRWQLRKILDSSGKYAMQVFTQVLKCKASLPQSCVGAVPRACVLRHWVMTDGWVLANSEYEHVSFPAVDTMYCSTHVKLCRRCD
jgi:hypothetical protein